MSTIKELLSTLHSMRGNNVFKRYIDYIQFPYYRNLEINTKINFSFPLTVFVGPNGCGKSSVLQALYGTVRGKTPSEFWFDTKIDPIHYYDDEKRRHSFWYSYKDNFGVIKEVVKARIKRANDPNYWETSRPLVWAGMRIRENKNERDSPIEKNVVYLDFRSELSAFDKFFYFGNIRNITSKNKQEFIRRKSGSLNNLLKGEVQFINSSTRELNAPLELLSSDELENISFVLGREYLSGRSIKHSIFRNEGYSFLFETKYAKYSEAFAGSGEMAVVLLVTEVLNAPEYSLILLDEPEVSLHPGAQARLKTFLLIQIKIKKHQVILTTHSPSLVKDLPKESIKVFYQNPNSGRFLVKENLIPEEAFYYIEHPISDKKNIIVEDILAKLIISEVLKKMGSETQNLFNLKFNPGGSSVIKKEFATVFCRDDNSKDYIFFDGDQKRVENHFDWRHFTTRELTVDYLRNKIEEQTGETIKFSVDSGEKNRNDEQQLELLKKYLDYFKSNVFYLPGQISEDIIWNNDTVRQFIQIKLVDTEKVSELMNEIGVLQSSKEKFARLSQIVYGSSNATDIGSIHKLFIQYWVDQENETFIEIKNSINSILGRE